MGPVKPQQPIPLTPTPLPQTPGERGRGEGDAGANSYPVRPGEIRSCSPARLFVSAPWKRLFSSRPSLDEPHPKRGSRIEDRKDKSSGDDCFSLSILDPRSSA